MNEDEDYLIKHLNKAQQLIDHINTFPDGTFLVPHDTIKDRCVDALIPNEYGIVRYDGMRKEIFLDIVKRNYINHERKLRELNKNETRH